MVELKLQRSVLLQKESKEVGEPVEGANAQSRAFVMPGLAPRPRHHLTLYKIAGVERDFPEEESRRDTVQYIFSSDQSSIAHCWVHDPRPGLFSQQRVDGHVRMH
jgi:hypothetical protein